MSITTTKGVVPEYHEYNLLENPASAEPLAEAEVALMSIS